MSEFIYRRVALTFWTDAKIRKLSRPPPNGRDLFLYLLTAKESIVIPGVIPAGAAALSETLRWPVEGFREAFGEAFREGLAKGDWDAPLVWVPKATVHNPPASPNVIKSWAKAWPGVPECDLKAEIFHALKAFAEGLGEGFGKAFREGFGEALPESGTGSGTGAVAGTGSKDLVLAPSVAQDPPKPPRPRRLSPAETVKAWIDEQRSRKTQAQDEAFKPQFLNGVLGAILKEVGEERFRVAYLAYLEEPKMAKKSPPWPLRLFLSIHRQYLPKVEGLPSSDAKNLVTADADPYAEDGA